MHIVRKLKDGGEAEQNAWSLAVTSNERRDG
jgi:hypothetical protein